MWLRAYVPETDVGRVRIGQAAAVSVDAFPGRTFAGSVTEIASQAEFTPKNVQTREERVKLVFGVKIEVDNPGGDLKPGMPADAVITVK
jgi:HlyD family secretion protein